MKAKRNLALAAVALLAAAMLASCSNSSGRSASSGAASNSLSVLCWDPELNIYAMNKAAEVYAKDHPGFAVNVTENSSSNDIEVLLTTIASSGDHSLLPDIFLMQDNSLQKYVAYYPELFTDLTDSGIDFSEFAPSKVAYSTIGGRHYGVPFPTSSSAGPTLTRS